MVGIECDHRTFTQSNFASADQCPEPHHAALARMSNDEGKKIISRKISDEITRKVTRDDENSFRVELFSFVADVRKSFISTSIRKTSSCTKCKKAMKRRCSGKRSTSEHGSVTIIRCWMVTVSLRRSSIRNLVASFSSNPCESDGDDAYLSFIQSPWSICCSRACLSSPIT